MPLILTDEYIRKNCMSAYPVPLKALKGLKPNADKTPNYISKRGRSGIRPADLPIYAPASVRSLANSISNISKLEPAVVETYLENMINNMSPMEELEQILMEQGEMDFLREDVREQEETKEEEIVLQPVEQIMLKRGDITYATGRGGGGGGGDARTQRVIPRRDERGRRDAISQTRKSYVDGLKINEELGLFIEEDAELREIFGVEKMGEMTVDPRRFRSGSGFASAGVASGRDY